MRTLLSVLVLACLSWQGMPAAARQPELAGPVRVNGTTPQLVADGQHLWLLATVRDANGDQNLMLHELDRATLHDLLSVRVNPIAGSVRTTPESAAVLLLNPKHTALYAVWNELDPRHKFCYYLVAATFDFQTYQWTPPVRINDDSRPTSHSFQGAAVGPDGTLHVAWIDRRLNALAGDNDYTGGGEHGPHGVEPEASLYYAASTDGGRTFHTNRLVAGRVCACCHIGVVAAKHHVVLVWRSVQMDQVRDITLSTSKDRGRHWAPPAIVAPDHWVIQACPHAGPSVAVQGSTIHVAWMTGAGGAPVVRVATSHDMGRTFARPANLSGSFRSGNHPVLAQSETRITLLHEGLDAQNYRHIYLAADPGRVSGVSRQLSTSQAGITVSSPALAADANGVVAAWTTIADKDRWITLTAVP